jgi:type VI protein secretion system component VasK
VVERFAWGIAKGAEVERDARAGYLAELEDGMARPVRAELEARLARVPGDRYLEERRLLRVYLMMGDRDRVDAGAPEDDALNRENARHALAAWLSGHPDGL